MSKKKKDPAVPRMTRHKKIALPPKRERTQKSVGVQDVRRSARDVAPAGTKRTMRGREAAMLSTLFGRKGKTGGEAFERWLTKEKGIIANERRTQADWDGLLQEFAAKPIHGHRRGRAGGNHRKNR